MKTDIIICLDPPSNKYETSFHSLRGTYDIAVHSAGATIPFATTESHGVIQVGDGLSIDENGILSIGLPDGDGVEY